MAYKKLYVDGFATINASSRFYNYQLPSSQMELRSNKVLLRYEDDVRFQHDLECELESGYFHLVIMTDRDQILSIDTGYNAEGEGCDYDLSHLSITYGRDPFVNNLFGQF
jgi:hypothetical protein